MTTNQSKAPNKVHLASLDAKAALIRDRVKGVVQGWITGLYLWGDGGVSKTYTVEQCLKNMNTNYRLTNSRLTGKGLFELLRDFPSTIHVLDDLESMLVDKNSHGVLRSALWATPDHNNRMDRTVCWHVGGKRQEFLFTSGIILIANTPLDQIPTLRAMGTRIPILHHQPTPEEMEALLRSLAEKGHKVKGYQLSPKECHEVVDEVVYLSQFLQKPVDIRLYVNGLMDLLQFRIGATETHWLEMLESRIKQRMVQREDCKDWAKKANKGKSA